MLPLYQTRPCPFGAHHPVDNPGYPGDSDGKASACNVGDLGSIPGSGRSPGEGNDNPLQYSCLENPMDGGAWQATVHGVAKSRTRLSRFTLLLPLIQGMRDEQARHRDHWCDPPLRQSQPRGAALEGKHRSFYWTGQL